MIEKIILTRKNQFGSVRSIKTIPKEEILEENIKGGGVRFSLKDGSPISCNSEDEVTVYYGGCVWRYE